MESAREQHRFHETNRIIEQQFGRLGSILEIGCGEGHQSAYLSSLCDRFYGFDVSASAVTRARQRLPSARLSVSDISSYMPEVGKFDLVLACEVLYYLKDIPATLGRMNELGDTCLVTYCESGPCILDHYFEQIPNLKIERIDSGNTSWKVIWWRTTLDHDGRLP